jgi:hypothetical protein
VEGGEGGGKRKKKKKNKTKKEKKKKENAQKKDMMSSEPGLRVYLTAWSCAIGLHATHRPRSTANGSAAGRGAHR